MLGSPLLLTWAAACGARGGSVTDEPATDETTAPDTETGLLPCSEDRHLVVFDIVGLLTAGNIEVLGPWVNEAPPTPRPGTVETAHAWRSLGYEVLYVTTIPPGVFPGRQVVDVASEWLDASGYPMDPEGTHVWAPEGEPDPDTQSWVSITDELLRYAGEGVSVDAGYSENTDKLYAMATGGVPAERLYSITGPPADTGPQTAPTTPIPGDDLVAHAATVQQLEPVCEVAAG